MCWDRPERAQHLEDGATNMYGRFSIFNRIDTFDCSQCPVNRESFWSLLQRLADGPVGPTNHSHIMHYSFHGQLDRPCLRDPSCRHPHSKSHGGLRIRTYHWAHTGLYFLLSYTICNVLVAAKPEATCWQCVSSLSGGSRQFCFHKAGPFLT